MRKIVIKGNNELSGNILIGGAKNSAVALLPAAILCDESSTIYNVPNISDKKDLIDIIKLLNCEVEENEDKITINSSNLQNKIIPAELSRKLRASYYFMGALLGKYKKVEMFFPGGCNIGERPINLHLKGFEALGATVQIIDDKYTITADELIGTDIYLDFASVGATINLMLASVKAKGITTINNAARETEIVNIATFLNNMGAKISGAGTSEIKIQGVQKLHKAMIEVIPDRIEAGTYIIAGALLGNNLKIHGVIKEHLEALLGKLKDMGVKFSLQNDILTIDKSNNLSETNIKTLVFPGFPTDLGQPMTVLLTQVNGKSYFEETIWDNRMGHVPYLLNMGANIIQNENKLIIKGKTPLIGKNVVATDLRGGAAMILAGLIADGKTIISDIEHILRGYENIIEKLSNCGADIKIIEEN